MSGGGGGIIIIKRLLEDCPSRLTAEEKSDLTDIAMRAEVVLSPLDALRVATIVYRLSRRP